MKKLFFIMIILCFCGMNAFASASQGDSFDMQTPDKEMIEAPKIYIIEKILYVEKIEDGAKVEIYNIVGSRVQSSALVNGCVDVSNLSKGIYIVRVAKFTQKIIIR